jgi:hypothetical protein
MRREELRAQLLAGVLASTAVSEVHRKALEMHRTIAEASADAAEVADELVNAMLARMGHGPAPMTAPAGLLAEVFAMLCDDTVVEAIARARYADRWYLTDLVARIKVGLGTR